MKIRLLHEIDLANIASLPLSQRRSKLQQLKDGRPTFSYGPLRKTLLDIFNVAPGLFPAPNTTDWTTVKSLIVKRSKAGDELAHNLRVAKVIYQYAIETHVTGHIHHFYPMALSLGVKVQYWLDMILLIEHVPIVPFIDPRISAKLTDEGRRFVFSVMHERIRAADSDFADVKFGIFQLSRDKDDKDGRTVSLHTDEDIKLMSFYELDQAVTETYDLWTQIQSERQEEDRRRAGGSGGLL